MKKIVLMTLMMLILSTAVSAVNINTECKNSGFDYGIVKYDWENNAWQPSGNTHNTSVIGNDTQITYNAGSSLANGLVVKAGNTVHYGIFNSTEGLVEQDKPAISHVVFCNKKIIIVPEFGTIGAVITLLGAGAFIMYRGRKRDVIIDEK